jgi:UDP:flavonoid glycosyltransferase YjiC (YdhE family)
VVPPLLQALPGAPLVVSYAPQRELLSRAAVAITHAGLNTALEALVQGVPMVALPVTNDQPGVAARLAWLGAAEVVPRAHLEPAVLRRAVERVLTVPSYREAAQGARAQIARRPGVAIAADIIERVLATGRALRT